jgi:serine/threonine protein kinase
MLAVDNGASVDDEDEGVEARAEQRIGVTLGKYTLARVLGVGGMASVYEGTHRNGNKVAIKVLHPELCISKDIRERFLREGYVANRVEHHGAVRVLDDEVAEDGTVFLVMELLEGETLEDFIQSSGGTLSPREVVPLACQLLDVLSAAHERGIVHRDIKPENLFIQRRDGSVKVLDFGIARLADGKRQATRTGRVLGTPAYMSPEQARGETKLVDGQTDVWAAGAVIFRALMGRTVHEAETAEMSMILAATTPVRRMAEVLVGLEPKLAKVIDRALESRKEDRWPDAQSMLEALRALPVGELSESRFTTVAVGVAFDRTEAAKPDVRRAPSTSSEKSTLPSNEDERAPIVEARARKDEQRPSTTGGLEKATPEGKPARSGVRFSVTNVLIAVLSLLVAGTTMSLLSRPRAGEPSTTATQPEPAPAASGSSATSDVLVAVGASAAPVLTAPSVDAAATSQPSAALAKPITPPPHRTPPPPTATPASVTPPLDCNPPYTLTAAGTRKYKPECVR